MSDALERAFKSVSLEVGTMKVGTNVLKTVPGTTTNTQGMASATFTRPSSAKAKVPWAYTMVT